ncbi:MAG: family 78 glycoside hydrolase catalytic domain [Clostridia bacterium]|nr:family 78 glycoside hydrolase catalytic domain [Clostridia bacterium]
MLNNSKWIGVPVDFGSVCPVFYKKFDIKKGVLEAKLQITAVGCYIAYLNEERIGNFVMAPGWTNYNKRLQVQEYDVKHLLKPENELKVEAGPGWHLSRQTVNISTYYKNAELCVIYELNIKYEDGTEETIVSDSDTLVSQSSVLFSGLYEGEVYDSRKFEKVEYPSKIIDYTHETLIKQEGETVVEKERIPPVSVHRTRGGYILDFGENITGYVEFAVNAPSGHIIELDHGEILDSNNELYTENLRTAWQKIQVIANGTSFKYKPKFTFQGFRYVRVINWWGELNPEDFTAVAVYSDIKRTGYFTCSNDKINKLFENVIRGQKGNFLDVPTDCPQRDERLGWTGDTQVFIKTAAYNFDVEKFFDKWLNDLASEQFEDGGVPAIIPNVFGTDSASSSAWGDAAVICPWQIYLSYGNKDILKRQYNSMCKWVDYIKNQGDNPYLWNTGHHFGDWLALDAPYGSYLGATDKALIATAFFAYSTSLVVKAGKVLGCDVSEYEKLYNLVRKEFQNNFVKGDELTSHTQTAYALAVYFELVDDIKAFGDKLNTLVKENGNKLKTGFVGTPYLLHALTKAGFYKTAYSLLLKEEFPSWLYSVNQGATTIWEHWDGIDENGKLWSPDMNSFNHYAYGCVADWMYEVVAGIRIDENNPAFNNIIFHPVPDERLDFANGSVETKNGIVKSEWKREGNNVNFRFTVPSGSTATVILGEEIHNVGSGVHTFSKAI